MNLLSATEVARRLGVTARTVRNWCKAGLFDHAQQVGNAGWVIPEDDLANFQQPKVGYPRGRPRKYDPRRGGHAPGHLREAFLDWLDLTEETDEVEIDGEPQPLRWLVGQLWNCTDCMPGWACDNLDLLRGSTYAHGVRKVAHDLEPPMSEEVTAQSET